MVMESLAHLDQVAYVRFASVYKNFQRPRTSNLLKKSVTMETIEGLRRLMSEYGPRGQFWADQGWKRGAMDQDISFMRHALALSRRGLGQVAPNPSVGCVIVRDGRIVGRGWTQRGGRPHAEPVALADAGDLARGATVYVSLEPCAHYGASPPCTDALIAAGVARVVYALRDPDPRVDGAGHKRLSGRDRVVSGVLEQRQSTSIAASQPYSQTPLRDLKLATSLDGKVALSNGRSQWITAQTRVVSHQMRARQDAIVTGIAPCVDDPL